jgi:hypothetical protein
LAAALLAAALAVTAPARAQAQAQAAVQDPHDLSGYWDLAIDSRKVPRAHLQPGVTAASIAAHAKADAHAVRWCNMLGLPYQMDSGRPLNIRQGRTQLFIYAAAQAFARYVYLNRREHIPGDEYDNSTQGDSYGWWEGDTLVVDTAGFNGSQGITAIPGGGYRTEGTHLVEKLRLVEDGKILQVVSAWTDPKVFVGTHSYEFRYYRLPETFVPAQRVACNPYDDERTRFLEGPAPAPKAAAAKHK